MKENTHDISSKKRVTKKFLEVSRCNRAKQRQRNVQKKVCCTCKVAFLLIGHFTVMDGSDAVVDLVLIQTFLLYYVNQVIVILAIMLSRHNFHNKAKEVCIKTRSLHIHSKAKVLTRQL